MMSLTEDNKKDIVKCLKELGCCSRCIVRFLGIKCSSSNNIQDTFLGSEDFIKNLEENSHEDLIPNVKRVKTNPCRVCLDILENRSIENFLANMTSEDIDKFKYNDYQLIISLPKSMFLRDHSMFLYLKEKFPSIYTNLYDLENVKRIFKAVSSDLFGIKMSRKYNPSSNFLVNIHIQYEDDEKEMEGLQKLESSKNISKTSIGDVLSKCTDEAFKSHYPVPPEIPNKLTFANFTFSSEPLFLGGRYLKFSRDMGQSPWIINNKPMTKYCLMDIIFDSIEKVLGFDKNKMTFSASGREDADTRMLGNGRPFYIQVVNPLTDDISFERFREIEADILKSEVAAVLKLQTVSRLAVKKVKDGEEFKKKHYSVLCKTTVPDMECAIKTINKFGQEVLEIDQKTPLRVLHRRTLATRKKLIYSMTAASVPGNSDLFYLELVTQAGTYVKEFVHSDFHRTQPSLTHLIGNQVDVVALDVIKVELEWP
nr:putative tRNA pseudouridine synthase Pus10 [Leptinotarsa decemlineata]